MSDEELKILFKNTEEQPAFDFTDNLLARIESEAIAKKQAIFKPSFILKYSVPIIALSAVVLYLLFVPSEAGQTNFDINNLANNFSSSIKELISSENSIKIMLFLTVFMAGTYLLDRFIFGIFKKSGKLINI